jgi:hypothetical protein
MRWRVLVWTAVATASAGAIWLVVEIATGGVDKASGLAGVIVGFCELAALVLGVFAYAAERREPGRGADAEPTAPAATAPAAGPTKASEAGSAKYAVDARGAHGVQTGERNTQHNQFR